MVVGRALVKNIEYSRMLIPCAVCGLDRATYSTNFFVQNNMYKTFKIYLYCKIYTPKCIRYSNQQSFVE